MGGLSPASLASGPLFGAPLVLALSRGHSRGVPRSPGDACGASAAQRGRSSSRHWAGVGVAPAREYPTLGAFPVLFFWSPPSRKSGKLPQPLAWLLLPSAFASEKPVADCPKPRGTSLGPSPGFQLAAPRAWASSARPPQDQPQCHLWPPLFVATWQSPKGPHPLSPHGEVGGAGACSQAIRKIPLLAY